MNYVIFFLKYIGITLVFAGILYMRLVHPHKLRGIWRALGALGCLFVGGASAFALPISIKLAKTRELYDRLSAPDLLPFLYYVMVLMFVLIVCIAVRDLLWIANAAIGWIRRRRKPVTESTETQETPEKPDETAAVSRREFLRRASTAAVVGGAVLATPALAYFGKKTRVLRHFDIAFANLPAGLDGLRIVHLSDVHVGNTIGREDIAEIVAETNAQNPDLIAITGDIADGYPEQIGSWLDPMRDFQSRLGTWFVTGNHDHMWDARGWCDVMRRLGAHVLDNEHEIVDVGGTPLAIAGAIDAGGDRIDRSWKSDPAGALANIAPGIFRLMLVHKPASVDPSFDAGADLVLLGHTHGGQCIPLNFIVESMHKYASGLYRVGERAAFVSCGTGYWGPPLRLGIPCEIDVLTLRKA